LNRVALLVKYWMILLLPILNVAPQLPNLIN
jgi:hypothetical protein